MIKLYLYADKVDDLVNLKNAADKYADDYNFFINDYKYPMDILDTLIHDKPEKCAVLFDTNTLSLGLEIAQKVHEINPGYRFVLICPEYCNPEQMYYMGVTYFVNKPYGDINIFQCIENIIGFYSNGNGRMISLKKKSGTDVIHLAEIRYIMSDKRKVIVCSEEKQEEYYYKLDEVEELLDDGFVRCHQSYIVNMKKIKILVDEGLMLLDGTFIPISRKNHANTRKTYMRFISGEQLFEM